MKQIDNFGEKNIKITAIGLNFNSLKYRIPIFAMAFVMIFVRIEYLFLILVSIGAPHVTYGLYREYKRNQTDKSLFLKALCLNFIIAMILLLISKQLFLYVTFFRFVIHFYQDRYFNFNSESLALSISIAILFFSLDFCSR